MYTSIVGVSTPRRHDGLDARGVRAEQALEQTSLPLELGEDAGNDDRQAFQEGLGLAQELRLDLLLHNVTEKVGCPPSKFLNYISISTWII